MMKQTEKKKRIGIDARFYGPIGKGLGRYTKEVVDRVVKMDNENEYIIFLGKNNFNDFRCGRNNVKKVLADIRWYTVKEQLILPLIIRKEKVDLMHFPHFNVPLFVFKKFIVTIHDLILTKHPTQRASTLNPAFYKLKHLGYKMVIRRAVKKAQKIIAVSEYTKKDISRKFRIDKNKIELIYEGISDDLKNTAFLDDKKVLFRYNINSPYLLYVGNAYPHKNLEGLIKIFSKIKKKNTELKLVLVGKEDYFYKRVKDYTRNFDCKSHIIFPGFVPDRDLTAFYRQALFYIFPSFHEGFGLPPLEAMAHGCAVLSSNKTCLPEILGEAALYFDPDDNEDFEKAVKKLVADRSLRQDLIMKGYRQIKKYSWDICARQTISIYRNHT